MEIESGKEIKFENVASFRMNMKESEIQKLVVEFINHLNKMGTKKSGPMITAIFGVEAISDEKMLDMEFLIPIDRKVELNAPYTFKRIFHLVNAVHTRYKGKPNDIQTAYDEITYFIQKNQMHQITVAYNVNVNDDKTQSSEVPIIDVYVGVNASCL
ncbi:hypothetical protein BSK64_00215 [Paenibacillus odorifer]|uniref:GyrI-like domain-containing protein n=1 Tax=Paenibacillus odorifer TaxID=189426 RepID=UPI00096EAD02|nr:GyrI-like domain-containing protein [Paenibacillus odorifer]OME08965.1 hypothetical protein BSK64_00215 [Paenibacillus odorifer]